MHMLLLLFLTTFYPHGQCTPTMHPLSDEYIDAINNKQNSWIARRNFAKDIPISYLRNLLGALPISISKNYPVIHHTINSDLPDHFDWREKYPNCSTLSDIRDQGGCGSCWAFGVASAISDRICIHSDGKTNVYVSADDILSCSNCGGCNGGYIDCAVSYWKKHGVVSGGPYGSKQGCQPYEIPPCEHHVVGPRPNCSTEHNDTPSCKKDCQSSYDTPYSKDLHFASSAYNVKKDPQQIQAEIMTNGPVTAVFWVYSDFYSYKSGVYETTEKSMVGAHAVKIMGWGIENGKPYWLIANSWNADWGDKGFVKFLRGQNHCQIESTIFAGIPV